MINDFWVFILSAAAFVFLITLFFCILILVRKKSQEKASLALPYLPEAKYISISDAKLCYYQEGVGPDLLLIHGLGASSYIWRFIFKTLTKHYRVTALDLAGFGNSSKDPKLKYDLDTQTNRLIEFIDTIKLINIQIIASSMGAAIGLWAVNAYPERFSKIIAMAPATNAKLIKISPVRFSAFTPALHKLIGLKLVGPSVIRMIIQVVFYNTSFLTNEDLVAYHRPYQDPDALKTFILATKVITDKRLPKGLSAIRTPTTIIWGSKDRMIPEKYIKEIHNLIAHSKVVKIDKTGHHPMEESPAETVKVLIEELI